MATDKQSVKACCEDDAQQEGTHSAYCDYHPGNQKAIVTSSELIPIELVPFSNVTEPPWIFPV